MKLCTLLLVLSFYCTLSAQQKFLGITYDKVIMYEYDGGKEGELTIVDEKGNFAKTVSKQVVLDERIIAELNKKLTDKKSFGAAEAFCYEPRLGFVYFLNGKIVGKTDVCLMCNRLRSSFNLDAQKQGKQTNDGEVYYIAMGMSAEFKLWLNQLIKSAGFKFVLKN